jgi:hypothetical protein
MYYDELAAGSKEEAAEYFVDHMREDVREYARSPVLPFSPLKARRKLDTDEDAR